MKPIKSRLLFLVAILSLAGACNNPAPKQAAVKTTHIAYTCPMHPQILEDHPGNCPICNMRLVKKSGQATEGAGISLNTVLMPVNSTVIATIPAITPKKKIVATQVTAQGYLDFDSRTFNNIASRYSGRIEKLYVKYAFHEVYRGEPLFDIYSPEMVSAQQDYIFLNKNPQQEISLINAAKQKLVLLGMTGEQINHILKTGRPYYKLTVFSPYDGHVHDAAHSLMSDAKNENSGQSFENNLPLAVKEGMYVEKGQTVFNLADPHHLWAILKIDRSASASVKLNQLVTLGFPGTSDTISGKVNFIEPMLRMDDKNITIRVYLHNMDHSLKVNSLVTATIQTGTTDGLWIPRSALLNLGRTNVVWIKNGSVYKTRQVTTGTSTVDNIQIKSGLSETDSIAYNAQYLTDSESFIKTDSHEK